MTSLTICYKHAFGALAAGCVFVGLFGCTQAGTDVEAVADVLSRVNDRSRETHISDFITSSADSLEGIHPGHFENVGCPIAENTYIGQYSVRSEFKRESPSSVTIESYVQEWQLLFSCKASGSDDLYASLLILKTQSPDGLSGTASITGSVDGGRGGRCDVSFDLDYEPATGSVSSAQGEICGKDIADDAALFVVPGFADEHLAVR